MLYQCFPEPFVRVSAFGDSSVELKVYFWCEMEKWFELKSDMMAAIFEAFKLEGITIPFPQRDLHIIQDNRGVENEKEAIDRH